MKTKHLIVGTLALAAASCASGNRGAAPAGSASPLQALMAEEWAARMRDDPLLATQSDVHDYDHRLPSVAPATFESQGERDRRFQERLAHIDRGALGAR
jgi:hypothetical protein